jgi:hypothetical protein
MPSIARETDASKISSPTIALAYCMLGDSYLPHAAKPEVRPYGSTTHRVLSDQFSDGQETFDHTDETCVGVCFRGRAVRAYTSLANPHQ